MIAVIKYIKYLPYLLILLLASMWYFAKESRIKFKSELKTCKIEKDSSVRAAKLLFLDYQVLKESKTKSDTFYEKKIGAIRIEYENLLKQKPKTSTKVVIRELQPIISTETSTNTKTLSEGFKNDGLPLNFWAKYQERLKQTPKTRIETVIREPQSTILTDTSTNTKTLFDTFKSDDLLLNYWIEYTGKIKNIDFTWEVEKERVEIQNIVEKRIPYPVPEKVSSWELGYYHIFDLNDIKNGAHDIQINRIWKFGGGVGGGIVIINGEVRPKIGGIIRF